MLIPVYLNAIREIYLSNCELQNKLRHLDKPVFLMFLQELICDVRSL